MRLERQGLRERNSTACQCAEKASELLHKQRRGFRACPLHWGLLQRDTPNMPAQTPWAAKLPALTFALLAALLLATAVRSHNAIAIATASVLMFACCWASFFGWVFGASSITFSFRMSVRTLALAIYASGMVFPMILGNPVDIRFIAPFAMGILLLCAIAGFQRWPASAHALATASGAAV